MIHTPPAAFSTITFYAFGCEIRVHDFLQREVRYNFFCQIELYNRIYCIFAAANPSFALSRK